MFRNQLRVKNEKEIKRENAVVEMQVLSVPPKFEDKPVASV